MLFVTELTDRVTLESATQQIFAGQTYPLQSWQQLALEDEADRHPDLKYRETAYISRYMREDGFGRETD